MGKIDLSSPSCLRRFRGLSPELIQSEALRRIMHTPAAVQKLGGNVKPGAFNAFARRGEAKTLPNFDRCCTFVLFDCTVCVSILIRVQFHHGQGGPTITMKPKSFPRFKFEPCE